MRTYIKYPKKEKQRKPKQRTREWCQGGGKVLEVFGVYDKKAKKEWGEEHLRKVEYIRCPTCNQKFEICNSEDAHSFSWEIARTIPKHKSY